MNLVESPSELHSPVARRRGSPSLTDLIDRVCRADLEQDSQWKLGLVTLFLNGLPRTSHALHWEVDSNAESVHAISFSGPASQKKKEEEEKEEEKVTSLGFAWENPIWEPCLKGYKATLALSSLICWMTLGKLPTLSGLPCLQIHASEMFRVAPAQGAVRLWC